MVIVHKDVIERYFTLFNFIDKRNISIFLNSFGSSNLAAYLMPQLNVPVIIIDIDLAHAEIVIALSGKMLLGRLVKLDRTEEWQNILAEEVNKTMAAYLKETPQQQPQEIIAFISGKQIDGLQRILSVRSSLPVSVLCYWEQIPLTHDLSQKALGMDNSFAALSWPGAY